MKSRSKSGVHKPKTILSLDTDIVGLKQANQDSNWREAMSEEFNALLANDTWDLVLSQPGLNLVGC